MRIPSFGAGCFLFAMLAIASPALAGNCFTANCHKAIETLKNLHPPVKDEDCLACHVRKIQSHPIFNGKSHELNAKVPALCNECHDPKDKKNVVHPPVKEGDCLACHKPHGGDGRFLLNVGEDQTGLCMECHDSALVKQKFIHGPVAVGSCTKCHDPHESTQKSLLKKPVRDLCLACHTDLAGILKEAAVVHSPVKSDACTVCHDPHGSPNKAIIKKKVPDLCVDCHADIGKKVTGVKVPHKPLQLEGGCVNCHSAHYAKSKGLLSADEKTVCLGCHDKDDMGTPRLRNIKRDLAGKKYLHGPINKGECKSCHDPHGSDNFRMLRGSYPAELYAPYKEGIYGACLACHNKNLLTFAETTVYTAFRNGSRNLHYVHVSNKRKGRTCRICHAPHASNGIKLIDKESIKFGEWDIPINFQINATGGSCAPGCHRAFSYDRDKPVVY